LGLERLNYEDGRWQSFQGVAGLPSGEISALALDGRYVWVGGMGYIGCLDRDQNIIRKFAIIPAQWVDKIQIGGGYVWAQFNWHLYRVPLSALD
jgi:hypothetical protein